MVSRCSALLLALVAITLTVADGRHMTSYSAYSKPYKPIVVVKKPEPKRKVVVVVVDKKPEPEPKPEVVVVKKEPEPEPEPEVVVVKKEPEPEPEPEVVVVKEEPEPEVECAAGEVRTSDDDGKVVCIGPKETCDEGFEDVSGPGEAIKCEKIVEIQLTCEEGFEPVEDPDTGVATCTKTVEESGSVASTETETTTVSTVTETETTTQSMVEERSGGEVASETTELTAADCGAEEVFVSRVETGGPKCLTCTNCAVPCEAEVGCDACSPGFTREQEDPEWPFLCVA